VERSVYHARIALAGCILTAVAVTASGEAQGPPIRIGEINSYSVSPPAHTAVSAGVEMAVDEVNARAVSWAGA